MARTEIVEFKVDADEKARLKGYACDRGEPLGAYVRKAALSFPEYGKTPLAYETQRDKENKAKVREPDRESWIESMTRIHMMEKPGLSKHAARAKATEEYEATQ